MKQVFTILFVALLFTGQAQKQANNWVFGFTAGVSWNTGSPVAFTGTQIDDYEGCGSISDANGQLLFYTDGQTVWDKTNTVMPNGAGLNGNSSASEDGTIVPYPGNSNLYYIITIDAQGGPNGVQYSLVDMTLNGGLGDVTSTKNMLLYTPTTEKVCVTQNAAGNGYWVTTHQTGNNSFYSYQITSAGINTVPVVSNAGTTTPFGDEIGYMRFSPDGSLIAYGDYEPSVQVFNFDNSTGLMTPFYADMSNLTWPYSMEFSPSGRYLYVANDAAPTSQLLQYDLQAGSSALITASKTIISTSSEYYGAIQIAPDQKDYVAITADGNLSVINNPDNAGLACNYVIDVVPLLGGSCQLGLPTFVSSFFNTNGFDYVNTCIGDSTWFTLRKPADSAFWNFGDPSSGLADTSTSLHPFHIFTSADTFDVTVYAFSGGIADTITQQLTIFSYPVVNLGPDTSICNGQLIILDAGNPGATYLWQNGSATLTYTTDSAGTYWVRVSYGNCSATDTIQITNSNNLSVNLGNDTNICGAQTLVLNSNIAGATYQWQDGSTGETDTVTQAGIYSVTVDLGGCLGTDSVQVTAGAANVLASSVNTSICANDSAQICATSGFVSYHWNTGPDSSCFYTNQAGNYYVTVTDASGCTAESNHLSITVLQQPSISVSVNADTITLNSPYSCQWYLDGNLLPGDTFHTIVANQPGNYTVSIMDNNGCTALSNPININGINDINANEIEIYPNPLANGTWHVKTSGQYIGAQLEIFDARGRRVYVTTIENSIQEIAFEAASGVYLLQVNSNENHLVRKLVKL